MFLALGRRGIGRGAQKCRDQVLAQPYQAEFFFLFLSKEKWFTTGRLEIFSTGSGIPVWVLRSEILIKPIFLGQKGGTVNIRPSNHFEAVVPVGGENQLDLRLYLCYFQFMLQNLDSFLLLTMSKNP